MRKAEIRMHDQRAGWLTEDESGYTFAYDPDYLALPEARPVSLTLPLTPIPYRRQELFPFFDGLIPEGWLLNLTMHNWKLNHRDRMGLLLVSCQDCIGAVSVFPIPEQDHA